MDDPDTPKSEDKFLTHGNLGMISRAPCERCNNTWMSALESAAKPILAPLMHGNEAVLTPEEQLLIVRWFIKTIIMYEFLGGEERGPKYFQPAERHALMQSLSVPVQTLFFLGRYGGEQDIITRESRLPLIVTQPVSLEPIEIEGYTATIAIKQLALQVFSVRWPPDPVIGSLQFSIPGNWDDAVVDIGPTTGNVKWPPPAYFDDPGFGLFMNRWTTLVTPP
jgi:hypothetical protein